MLFDIKTLLGVFLLSLATCLYANAFEASVTSPEGAVVIGFALTELGEPTYQVTLDGKPVLLPSHLGFEKNLMSGFTKVADSQRSVRDSWQFAFGERSDIPDAFDELKIELEHSKGLKINLVLRAYDEGAAIRYEFPAQQEKGLEFKFEGEHTEFRLPAGTKAYEEHGTEGPYELALVSANKASSYGPSVPCSS